MITTIFYQVKPLPKFTASVSVLSAKFWWKDISKKNFNGDKVEKQIKPKKYAIIKIYFNDKEIEEEAYNKSVELLYGNLPTKSEEDVDKKKGAKLINKIGLNTAKRLAERVKQYATSTSQIYALSQMGIYVCLKKGTEQVDNFEVFDEEEQERIIQFLKEHELECQHKVDEEQVNMKS